MSTGDMPELGSKISLISKADIRYEGKLYTVDPQDCTIALANVRSFGTEDRKTTHPVPAQNQIYDYILFRATDIKDISVVPPTQLLCDPAIVQLSSSITNRSGGYGGNSTSTSNSEYPGMLGGLYQPSSGAPGGNASSGGGGGGGGGFNPMQSGLQALAQRQPAPNSEFQTPHTRTQSTSESVLDFLTGSRSSTPGLRKSSPTVDQGTQANPRVNKENNRNNQIGWHNRNQDHRGNLQQPRRMNNQQPQQQTRTYQQQNRGWQPLNDDLRQQFHNNRQQFQNHQQQHHQMQNHQQHQQQRNNQRRQNNNGRPFTRAPGPRPKPQPAQPLKFESDYDFDKANSEFEELKSELSKLKINGDANGPVPLVNGDAEKKDDSGNETTLTAEEQDNEYFYNKSKSFFDNISCEAIERSKGRSQRTDWRKERMLNSETFGVASARRNNYNRGRNGGYYYGNRTGGYFQRGFRSQQGGGGQRYRASKSPVQPQPQAATA